MIGRMIADRRNELGYSQTSLAKAMATRFPWHQTTVSRTETGERSLLLLEAVYLCELLGFDLNDLVAGTPPPPCRHCADIPPDGYKCMHCQRIGDASYPPPRAYVGAVGAGGT